MVKKHIGKWVIVLMGLAGLALMLLPPQIKAERDQNAAAFTFTVNPALVAHNQLAPQVFLELPETALPGEWVTIQLKATGAVDVAGFQADLSFDTTQMSLGTAQVNEALARGRDLISFGYIQHENGVVIAAAVCPVSDCASAQYSLSEAPPPTELTDPITLAEYTFRVRTGGTISVELADILLVDSAGNLLLASNQYQPPAGPKPAPLTLDLSGNNRINDADAYLIISAWRELQRTERCLAPTITHYDVDNSGCLDILDVQTILAAWGQQPTPPPPPATETLAPESTFTVNSSGNQSDLIPGDTLCLTAALTCTLRAAVQEANALDGADTILFDIRNSNGSCPSIVTITPTSEFIIDAADNSGITINGYSQCNASPNANLLEGNANIKIEIRGTNTEFVFGLHILSPHNVITGLAVYNWHRQIELLGNRSRDNTIQGNFIGTNAANNHTQSAPGIEGDGLRLEFSKTI